jgi:hypothetical protein
MPRFAPLIKTDRRINSRARIQGTSATIPLPSARIAVENGFSVQLSDRGDVAFLAVKVAEWCF